MEVSDVINNIYNKKGFLEKYGSDIWLSVIILLIFFVATTYYYVMDNIKPIVADWNNQKCNPAVIPFAGLINKPNGKGTLEFTGENFTGCVQGILANIASYAFNPIYYMMKVITDSFSELVNAINGVRAEFNKIRNSIDDFSSDTMGRTLNITLPIVQMLIGIKDMGAKIVGTLSASLYTLMGSYLTMKSLFLFIIDLIVKILIILAGIIAALLVIAAIPIIGAPAQIAVIPMIATMIAILIPTIMIQVFMSDIMKLSTPKAPGVPRCFAGNTLIALKPEYVYNLDATSSSNKLNNCTYANYKRIKDIEVGDILADDGIVTGILQLSSSDQTMYMIDGIIVSGEHRIYYPTCLAPEYLHAGWIKVKDHPKAIEVEDFDEPYIYCLVTTSKKIEIGNQIFCDWDELVPDTKLYKNVYNNAIAMGYVPEETLFESFNGKDIHKYLNNGLYENSVLELENGSFVAIKDIKVNSLLKGNIKVLGLIKIDAQDLEGLYEFTLGKGTQIIGSHNLTLYLNNLGISHDMENTHFVKYSKEIKGEKYVYQLLTDKGYFHINGISIGDYNKGIDNLIN